jgi:hypothetical protein
MGSHGYWAAGARDNGGTCFWKKTMIKVSVTLRIYVYIVCSCTGLPMDLVL